MIGYARCSTVMQDLVVQRRTLGALGVPEERIYTDRGLTGRNRDRPGLREALAAVRSGDTLVVARLDRLARSVRDACSIADELEQRGVRLQVGGSLHDPSDPIGRMFFNVLAVIAQFEADLLSIRTREGMAVARANGRLKGGIPKLSAARQKHVAEQYVTGKMTIPQLAELVGVSRATIYRTLSRQGVTSR